MAINFPSTPTLNDTYTYSGSTWTFNGTGWAKDAEVVTGLPDQTGNSGKYLTTDGSIASWGTVSGGGGASFPIGSVISGPSAPVDGGTWLSCANQAVEQATYPLLYSAIGKDYAQYKLTRMVNKPTGFVSSSAWFVYSGTAWLHFVQGATTVNKSVNDGDTWTAATALPLAPATWFGAADGNGSVYVHGNSTNLYKTSNDGTSWTTSTLPIVGTASIFWGFNGPNNIVITTTNSANIYYSTNGGSTWSTVALPSSTGSTNSVITWDGSAWYITTTQAATNITKIFTTSSATGATGWSESYPSNGTVIGGTSFYQDVIKGTGKFLSVAVNSNILQVTADSGRTTLGNTYFVTAQLYGVPFWNGQHFILIASGLQNGATYVVDADGNASIRPLAYGALNGMSTPFTLTNLATANRLSSNHANFTTNVILLCGTDRLNVAAAADYVFQIAPVATATQFCLPPAYPQAVGGFKTSWIKAA